MSYWDLETKEKAALDESEVRAMLDAALMERGVLKIKPPALKEAQPLPEFKTRDVYVASHMGEYRSQIEILAFEDEEKAVAFLKLKPMKLDTDYDLGRDKSFAKPFGEMSVAVKTVFDYQDLLENRKLIKENAAIESSNTTAQEEYRKAAKEQDDVLDEVWADWCEAKDLAAKHKKIADTMSEYLGMSDNNRERAGAFLLKVFPQDEIEAAMIWFGETWFTLEKTAGATSKEEGAAA